MKLQKNDELSVIFNNTYILVPTEHLTDSRLSWQSKGLLTELLAQSKTDFTIDEIMTLGSRNEIFPSLNELKKYGYLRTEVQ